METGQILRFENPSDYDNAITILITYEGISVSVSDEQAIGSYNEDIECDFHLSKEQAIELRDWLIINLPPLRQGASSPV